MTDHEKIRLYAMANLLEKEARRLPRWDAIILLALVELITHREWFFFIGVAHMSMTLSA